MTVTFPGLKKCSEDVVSAAKKKDKDIPDKGLEDWKKIAAEPWLPKGYTGVLLSPFRKVFDEKSYENFFKNHRRKDDLERQKQLVLDIAQAITQREYLRSKERPDLLNALDAAQEVAADLYDDFFDEGARQKIYTPSRLPLATYVAWGGAEGPRGAYAWHRTWTADQGATFGPRVPLCTIPVGGASGGLLGWAVLSHETIGHDVLSTYEGLLEELSIELYQALKKALQAGRIRKKWWPAYWESKVDEAASDLMGVLNMGPVFGVALIGYMRAFRALHDGGYKLAQEGKMDDPYPADFLRVYLVASGVGELNVTSDVASSEDLEKECDGNNFKIDGEKVSREEALTVARIVADTILNTHLKSLENARGEKFSLREIQDWTSDDEALTKRLRSTFLGKKSRAANAQAYAAHLVAAAVIEAVNKADPPLKRLQEKMIELLSEKYQKRQSSQAQ